MNKIIFAFLILPALIMQIQVADLSPKDLSCSIDTKPDSTFKGRYYNKEYNIYIDMDLYHQNKLIPGQEFLGEVAGYLGDNIDSRKWIFTDVCFLFKRIHHDQHDGIYITDGNNRKQHSEKYAASVFPGLFHHATSFDAVIRF